MEVADQSYISNFSIHTTGRPPGYSVMLQLVAGCSVMSQPVTALLNGAIHLVCNAQEEND